MEKDDNLVLDEVVFKPNEKKKHFKARKKGDNLTLNEELNKDDNLRLNEDLSKYKTQSLEEPKTEKAEKEKKVKEKKTNKPTNSQPNKKNKLWILILVIALVVILTAVLLMVLLIKPMIEVTFDANGGSFGAESTKVIKAKPNDITPPTPTKAGHTFVGWTSTKDGTTLFDFGKDKVKKGSTFYAKWAINDYNVTFNANGGTLVSGENIGADYNTLITKPTDPTKAGYTFVGWYKEQALSTMWNFDTDKVTNDLTLYAKWEANTYTISFDTNGGEDDFEAITLTYDSVYGELPTPTRIGYTFVNWTLDDEIITKDSIVKEAADHTLVAKWEINTYTITLNANGGELTNETVFADYNSLIDELEQPTYLGYTFLGWFIDESLETPWDFENDRVTSDLTLYAKWDLIYTYTETDGELTITGLKEGIPQVEDLVIPTEIDGKPVVVIANGAFQNDTIIKTVKIPNNIQSIGNGAFYGATNIKNVYIGSNVKKIGQSAFDSCTSLESIAFEDNCALEEIGDSAFQKTGIKEIAFPNKFKKLGNGAFNSCSNLGTVIFNDNIEQLGYSVFNDCTALTQVVFSNVVTANGTTLLRGIFNNCTSLTSITFGNNITEIPAALFTGCTSLKEIYISDSVTSISRGAFSSVDSLEKIVLGNGITEIISGSFYGCTSLRQITLGNNLEIIGSGVFDGCEKLEQIIIPISVTTIGNDAFQNCSATIFVEADTKPKDWSNYWNRSHTGNVYFGDEWEYDEFGNPTLL